MRSRPRQPEMKLAWSASLRHRSAAALALAMAMAAPTAARAQDAYGEPNPDAPSQLASFAFLIGEWSCESRIKDADGQYRTYRATWVGRYVMEGYVIADEYRQYDADGKLMQLGTTYRSYDAERGVWVMKWLDALSATWLDLGPQELGGVQFGDSTVVFQHYLPESGPAPDVFPAHTLFRITFHDIARDRFRWKAEVSTDRGASWDPVQTIVARRVED